MNPFLHYSQSQQFLNIYQMIDQHKIPEVSNPFVGTHMATISGLNHNCDQSSVTTINIKRDFPHNQTDDASYFQLLTEKLQQQIKQTQNQEQVLHYKIQFSCRTCQKTHEELVCTSCFKSDHFNFDKCHCDQCQRPWNQCECLCPRCRRILVEFSRCLANTGCE